MKPGDFVFMKTDSFSGKIISWFQRRLFGKKWSEVNHVAVCVESPDVIREAVMPRVKVGPCGSHSDRKIVAIARPVYMLPNEQLYRWLHKEKRIRGQYYGALQILGLAYCGILAMFGKKVDRNYIRAGRVCTEDAYMFKKDAEKVFGIVDDDGMQKDSIYPSQLLLWMEKSPNYEIIKGEKICL